MEKVVEIVKDNKEEWQREKEQVKGFLPHIIKHTNAFVEVTINIPNARAYTDDAMFKKALSFLCERSGDITCKFKDTYGCVNCAVLTVRLPTYVFKEYLEDKLAELITDARVLAEFLSDFRVLVNLVSESKSESKE